MASHNSLHEPTVFNEQQQHWLSLFDAFNLTSNQKKIILLGMNDREISPDDIYKALSTEDRNTYDDTVSPLRKADILQEIRTNPSASQLAKQKKMPKRKITRFKVRNPS